MLLHRVTLLLPAATSWERRCAGHLRVRGAADRLHMACWEDRTGSDPGLLVQAIKELSQTMQAAARCTPVVGRARRYRSQPLRSGPCARHPRRSRGCRDRGPHKRLANPRSLGRPGFPQRLQRKIGSALIKLEQNGALRRCPPALLPAPRPAARPRAREARQLPHVLLPPALLRRRARRLGGAAPRRCSLPARPPRWRGSAASSRSWRASAAGRPPCPRRPARPGS